MNCRPRLLLAGALCTAIAALTAGLMLWRGGLHREPRAIPHAFYLWQYDWTPAVATAVSAAVELKPDRFYLVAAELGGAAAPQPDWAALELALQPASTAIPPRGIEVVPVVRVHGAAARRLETDPDALGGELRNIFAKIRDAAKDAGLDIREVQLDLDCTERLLADYARLLRALKPRLGGLRLSVTAIPCHLANGAFAAVARAAGGYTLQVHGVEFPKRFTDAAAILDAGVAGRAVANAERLGVPYRLALPTYAYRFVFGADGRCRGLLQPFSPPPDPRRSTVRTVAADPGAVREIYQLACRVRHCEGVTWFRLPVKGDGACWELAAVAALRAGRAVECGLRAEWGTATDGRLELRLANHAVLDVRTATLALRWPSRQGDYGLIAAEADAGSLPGILPEQLRVAVPPPGETVAVAWFRTVTPPPAVIVTTDAAAE